MAFRRISSGGITGMTKRIILGAVAILMVIAAAYAAFFIAPEERTMGLIQRIFYFHVASAWAGFTAFFLWLLYVSYLLLRTLVDEPDRRALLSSLFGIFAFLDVPLVFGAIRWWRTQHPQPVIMGGQGSGLDPTMKSVFFFSALAMHVLMLFLVAERYALEKMQTETDFLAREVE